jgi:hypothetical protein
MTLCPVLMDEAEDDGDDEEPAKPEVEERKKVRGDREHCEHGFII